MSATATKTRTRKPTPSTDAYIMELRKAMQQTHPDRGGTPEAFYAARERFNEVKARAAARDYRQFEYECERTMRWWPDGAPTSAEWSALMRHQAWDGTLAGLRRYRETKTFLAQPETKTQPETETRAGQPETKTQPETETRAGQPETKTQAGTKTRNRGGRPPGVSAFAAWVLETKTPRASAYRQWGAFMSATGETKTAGRADADALAKFLRWRKA